MLQADSILNTENTEGVASQQHLHVHKQLTPAQVLSWLPASATPEQQDSAIQAHIKPSVIHWSNRPDTLHLPGQPVGKSWRDVNLPTYYKESFFSDSPMFHPELSGGRLGVAGDPVPYTVAGDNLITGILLGCFLLATFSFAQSGRFIARQVKNFFHARSGNVADFSETTSEMWFQLFLVLQTCLISSLMFFFYSMGIGSDTFVLEQYQIIGIYTAVISGYFISKIFLYLFVDWTLFDKRRNRPWFESFLFIVSTEGVLLFPMVMLISYFGLSLESGIIYSIFVIIIFKIMSFYKTYIIFFRQKGAIMQNILYFCALEVMPLLILWGGLIRLNSFLKINF
jgi:hypothetical protein